MFDLKNLQAILQGRPVEKNLPKHVIINLFDSSINEENKKANFKKLLELFYELITLQKVKNIPIFTINLGTKENLDENALFLESKKILQIAIENKINITIFGRWYDLKGQLVEELKKINIETQDFDHFFLNICINYNPKQEIADASRVIIRKILKEKLDIDSITPETFKENIYSSYFIPPDLIIEPNKKFSGTFLWDSHGAQITQLNKEISNLSKSDFLKAIESYLNE